MKSEVIKLIPGRDDVTLTTYIWSDSPELLDGRKRPAVIVCPGGAYLNCSDREGEPVALAFARMGFHAFVLRYSVAMDAGENGWAMDLSEREPKPERMHPQPMRDIALAFECLHNHSDEWLVDMSQVAICGFSAGAHNCAMYSTHWHLPVITEYVEAPKEALKPAACVLGYGITDYVYMREQLEGDKDAFAFFNGSNRQFLGKDWDKPETLLDASPARLVTENTPPTFIWSTFKDGLVQVQQSSIYATALAEGNVPFEIHIFQDGGHGMSCCDPSSVLAKSQIDGNAAQWVKLCENWIRNYLVISLPDETPWG